MSFNIMDLVKGYITPELTSNVASQLGENPSGVTKALSGLLPVVLGGLVNKGGDSSMLSTLTSLAGSGVLSNLGLGSTSNNSMITSILSSLFGDKVGSVVSTIASYAGIKESSAQSLLGLSSAATLGSVGKYAADHNLDTSGFSSLLSSQKSTLSSLIPAGLSLGSLGLGSAFSNLFGDVKSTVSNAASSVANEVSYDDNKGGTPIWKWLIPLILVGLLGWFLMRGCDKKVDGAGMNADSTATMTEEIIDTTVVDTSAGAVATVRESLELTLPSGIKINAYKGGIEDQIVTFLGSEEYKNATAEELKNKWFSFDNLNFDFGTTNLTKDSKVQLENLKAILKEFPAAKMKIGAYSDKKGDDKANLELSQKRADAVKTALGSKQVTAAEGYGEKFATVAETATDKEREADRKTAIRFEK